MSRRCESSDIPRGESKVLQYRDTASAEPGSGQTFGSVSGPEIQFLGIAYAKDTFCLY